MISVVYIVKDEILTLPLSVRSVNEIADEIVIVDTGSVDGTRQYAQHAANVFASFKWKDDFAAARNFAISKATKDWVLMLDADENIDQQATDAIRALLKTADVDCYKLQINNFYADPRWIKNPYVIYGQAARLFRNKDDIRYAGAIHERLIGYRTCKSVGIPINHFAFFEREKLERKFNQYKIMMDKRIDLEGWTHENCIHYADLYRKRYIYRGDRLDLQYVIRYLEKALLKRKNDRLIKMLKGFRQEYKKRFVQ